MADMKLPISANVKGVTDELDKIPTKVEQITTRLKKAKWTLFDLKAFEADLKKAEQLATEFHRKFGGGFGMGGGGAGGGGGYGPGGPSMPPHIPNPAPPRPASPRPRGRGAYTHAPQLYDAAQNFASGFGGGFGQITSYGTRGAIAGYRDGGGFGGGAAGLMKGLGIGALAYGALKLGQGVNEGYEMSKERAGSLDNLKRQLGDVGVSFEYLKMMSIAAADGLGLTSKESAKFMEAMNRESRGADGNPGALKDSTRTAIGVSRAYGLDPSVGVGFFGGMRNIDPKQNNRELAVLLAETIERSGMSARADEVMQSIQSFAAATSRMTLTSANLPAYAGAYGALVGGRTPGLTSEVAASLLSQANASVMRMGNAGEAGQNFTLTALSRYGALDPVQAAALAEGGLFGTRRSVFGNKALASYLGDAGANGPNADVTNFQALRESLNNMGGPAALRLDAAKRYFGVSSLSQAAALMKMDGTGAGNLQKALETAGVDLNSLNASGIQKLAKIGGTASREEILAAAKEGRQETEYTKMLDSMKGIEEMQMKVGDKLLEPITKIKEGVLYLADLAGLKDKPKAPQTGGASGSWGPSGGATGSWGESSGGSSSGATSDKKKLIADLEKKYGLPAGMLYGMWGTESSFGKNVGPSSAGALGDFQFMPGTAKKYGVKFGDFSSEAEGAAKYVSDLYRQRGSWKGALFGYNGVVNNTDAGEEYVRRVQQYGGMSTDITQLPSSHQQVVSGRNGASQQISINGSFTLNDPRGNPLSSPLITRMSVPSAAGAQ